MSDIAALINEAQLNLETAQNSINACRDALMQARKLLVPAPMKRLEVTWLGQNTTRTDDDLVTGYKPKFEPVATPDPEEDAIFGTAPKVETPAPEQPTERKVFKIASVKFDGMTPQQWHALADKFAADNPNWQKAGKVDMQHILISAGNAGYQDITADNIDDVFADIVRKHIPF